MKTCKSIIGIVVMCMLLCACDSSLQRKHLIGKWTQVNIESRIADGEPEETDETAVWTFLNDSTYTIEDEEQTETGRWSLEDSVLTLLAIGEDDSLTTSYEIILCQNDSLVHSSEVESDYGIITETTTLIKSE
ncbi:MAG: hypothetical protein J5720_00170 [Bacteroidaceae bacterium]|nr:hypothetical protein [Bacteroidaceae bacterium]